jgi:hypothetical protein
MKSKLNPKLKEGDRIVLIDMTDEPTLSFGDKGTFTGVHKGGGFNQYKVKWDKGGSLYMLDDDKWMKEEDFNEMIERKKNRNIQESQISDLSDDSFLLKHFNMLFLKRYLNKLRESSVVNMFAAAPYLYMGKERLAHEHKYSDTNESFDELLDMADQAQREMVSGVISILEDEDKELSSENINSKLKRYSPKIIKFYAKYY